MKFNFFGDEIDQGQSMSWIEVISSILMIGMLVFVLNILIKISYWLKLL